MSRGTRWRIAGYAFGLAGIAFTVVALWQTWQRSQQSLLPDSGAMLVAAILVLAGALAAGWSWLALFAREGDWRLLGDFYLAQLGKYIPGGLWQPAGQVGLTVGAGFTATRATANFAMHVAIQFAAGVWVGGLLVLDSGQPLWLRAVAGVGLLAPVLIYRNLTWAILRRFGGFLRLDADELAPPGQTVIIRSFLWTVGCLVAYGFAYGLLAHSLAGSIGILSSVPAFALAWAIGFALVVFPAGLGAREAALVVLVGAVPAVVIAASIGLRLIVISGELAIALVSRVGRS